ncbi:hypothetical protein C4587_01925 [Candidatus Parcubacteria bacterium]|nr:MAG: hypothetical protein C4587_01925 [Candidatus Parcubacteria bacterium]
MLTGLRIAMLKRRAMSIINQIYAIRESYSCGRSLQDTISNIPALKKRLRETLMRLKEIDPNYKTLKHDLDTYIDYI